MYQVLRTRTGHEDYRVLNLGSIIVQLERIVMLGKVLQVDASMAVNQPGQAELGQRAEHHPQTSL